MGVNIFIYSPKDLSPSTDGVAYSAPIFGLAGKMYKPVYFEPCGQNRQTSHL
jgi:hypothetical protein